jgi:hypothetical protein
MKVIRDNDNQTAYVMSIHVDVSDIESARENSPDMLETFLAMMPPYVGFDDETLVDQVDSASSALSTLTYPSSGRDA